MSIETFKVGDEVTTTPERVGFPITGTIVEIRETRKILVGSREGQSYRYIAIRPTDWNSGSIGTCYEENEIKLI